MRTLFFLTGVMFCLAVSAQESTSPALQSLIDRFPQRGSVNHQLTISPSPGNKLQVPENKDNVAVYTLPSEVKVYVLPQDNMPCVIPEVINTMPVLPGNLVRQGQSGAIPNPGYKPLNKVTGINMKDKK